MDLSARQPDQKLAGERDEDAVAHEDGDGHIYDQDGLPYEDEDGLVEEEDEDALSDEEAAYLANEEDGVEDGTMADPLELARATEDEDAFEYGTEKGLTSSVGYYDILRPDSTYDGGERYYFNERLSDKSPPRPHGSEVFGFESAWLDAGQDAQSTRWRALEQFYSANAVRERAAQAAVDLWLDEQEDLDAERRARAESGEPEDPDDERVDWLSGTAREVFARAEQIIDHDLKASARMAAKDAEWQDEEPEPPMTRDDLDDEQLEALRREARLIALRELQAVGPDEVDKELLKDLHGKFNIIHHHMELVARHRLDDIRARHLDPDHVERPVNWQVVGALLGRKGGALSNWAGRMEAESKWVVEQKNEKRNAILQIKRAEEELEAEMHEQLKLPHLQLPPELAGEGTTGGAAVGMSTKATAPTAAEIAEQRTGEDSEHGRMRKRVRDMLSEQEFDDDSVLTGEMPIGPNEVANEETAQWQERFENERMQEILPTLTPEEQEDYIQDRMRARKERRALIQAQLDVVQSRAATIEARELTLKRLRTLEEEEIEDEKSRQRNSKTPRELEDEQEDENRMRKQEFKPSDFVPYTSRYMRSLMQFPLLLRRTTKQTGKGKIHNNYILVVVGNGNGLMGVGEGKDMESYPRAKEKALADAVRNMDVVERFEERTIWTEVEDKLGATRIILRPRPVGFGLACNPYIHQVRVPPAFLPPRAVADTPRSQILKAAGVKDISAKVWGSRNPLNVIKTVTRLLHAGHAPVQFGSGTMGRGGRRLEGKQGVRGKTAVERERGRKLIPGRAW